jgi:hypothetical protein
MFKKSCPTLPVLDLFLDSLTMNLHLKNFCVVKFYEKMIINSGKVRILKKMPWPVLRQYSYIRLETMRNIAKSLVWTVRFWEKIFKAVNMKIIIFWDVTSCSSAGRCQHFWSWRQQVSPKHCHLVPDYQTTWRNVPNTLILTIPWMMQPSHFSCISLL